MHHIPVTLSHGACFQFGGVQAGCRLGHPETRTFVACHQRRKVSLFLVIGAELHDWVQTEDIHVNRRCGAVAAAGFRNGLHHNRGIDDAKTGTSVLFGDCNPQPTIAGQLLMQLSREAAYAIACQPELVVEFLADPQDRIADSLLFGCHLIGHDFLLTSCRPGSAARFGHSALFD